MIANTPTLQQQQQYVQPYPISPDMKYVPRNVVRQNQNFININEADGPINDVYMRAIGETKKDKDIFWFVGKVARVSDVSLEVCVARQWALIEYHAANLRPLELSSKLGEMELWIAPGDSELDIAYNRPDVVMQKMERELEDSTGPKIRNIMVGFEAEIYDQDEDGFRTWRTDDGRPAKPEVIPAGVEGSTEESREGVPTQAELEALIKSMDTMDAAQD